MSTTRRTLVLVLPAVVAASLILGWERGIGRP